MSNWVKGHWLDRSQDRNIVHRVTGNRVDDGIIWSNMTRCRHVRTVPARDVLAVDVPITCLFCVGLRGD